MSRFVGAGQLFVGRLAKKTRQYEIEEMFSVYGRMSRCEVKYGSAMAYAFIDYEDRRDAEDAIRNEHGREIHGQSIVVEWARGPRRGGPRFDDDYGRRDGGGGGGLMGGGGGGGGGRYRSRSPSPYYRRRRSRSRSYERRRRRTRSRSPPPRHSPRGRSPPPRRSRSRSRSRSQSR